MQRLIHIELMKVFRKPRTYISFIAIASIVLLIQLALYLDGETYVQFMLQTIGQSMQVEGVVLHGYFVCFLILQTLLIHVPLLIALVGGDTVAGEANLGTLRLLITRPVSRSRLLLAKFTATLVYTLLLLLWMAVLSLLFSVFLFSTGDLMIFKSDEIVILKENDILWRYAAAFCFAALAMSTVAALSFLLSVFADNSIGPIVTTMSIIIVCTILSTMDFPLFTAMKPYLFTSHILGWKGFFDDPVYYPSVLWSALFLFLHIVVFIGTALWYFRKKDILS
jgi:ABC-2 type transport system permease protein